MQTFLPLRSFAESAEVLDLRRLGKQIMEAGQIVRACLDQDYGWQSHPATRMWRGHESWLLAYTRACASEWESRRANVHGAWPNLRIWLRERDIVVPYSPRPGWLGDHQFHASHRANLLRKDPDHYGHFGWQDDPSLPYVWPGSTP